MTYILWYTVNLAQCTASRSYTLHGADHSPNKVQCRLGTEKLNFQTEDHNLTQD